MTAEEFYIKTKNYGRPNINKDLTWVFNFAEQYHEAKTNAEDKELLCSFFKYFRDNGEGKIGMSIEEFVNEFLDTHEQ